MESKKNTFGNYVIHKVSLGFPLFHFDSKWTRTTEGHGDKDLNITIALKKNYRM